jgi:hypothetical protein
MVRRGIPLTRYLFSHVGVFLPVLFRRNHLARAGRKINNVSNCNAFDRNGYTSGLSLTAEAKHCAHN